MFHIDLSPHIEIGSPNNQVLIWEFHMHIFAYDSFTMQKYANDVLVCTPASYSAFLSTLSSSITMFPSFVMILKTDLSSSGF